MTTKSMKGILLAVLSFLALPTSAMAEWLDYQLFPMSETDGVKVEYRLYRTSSGKFTKVQWRVTNNNRYDVSVKIRDVDYRTRDKSWEQSVAFNSRIERGRTVRDYAWTFGRESFDRKPIAYGLRISVERR